MKHEQMEVMNARPPHTVTHTPAIKPEEDAITSAPTQSKICVGQEDGCSRRG